MTDLLRAEWFRFRRRLVVWVILVAVLVFGGVGFLNGYKQDTTPPFAYTEAELRQQVRDTFFFEGVTDEEAAAEMELQVQSMLEGQVAERADFEERKLTELQKYDFGQAPLTVIGFGIIPLVALLLLSTLILGDEFAFGTIRSSLLAAPARRRFLAARFATIGAMTVGLFVALAGLGLILSLGLHLLGAELVPATIAVDLASAAALVASEILVGLAILAFAVFVVLLTRSGAIPFLVIIVVVSVESFVSALPIFLPGEPLAAVPQAFLTVNARTLIGTLGPITGASAVAGISPPEAAVALPLWTAALVVTGWLVLFLVLADRRLRRMDIVE